MANKYNFQEAEAKWQAFREEHQTNAFDLTKTDPSKIFSIDTPPPTVSGKLHIGHIFSYTQAEIIARYKRMKGFNVFYPMGYDDNGIPTEQLVERELKINIKEMDRNDFVEKCLEVNQKYRDLYKTLWQSLGFSIDWKRTYATISPEVQQLVQKRFVEMYKNGDIVGKQFPALRCTKNQTTIAQAETEEKEFNEFFNYLNFTLDDGEKLVIATTRPEMLPACVAVFAHPDDEKFAKYIGRHITTPLGDTVPLLGDDKVKMDKGSWVVMCCTYGDETDVYRTQKHNLPEKVIISRYGTIQNSGCEVIEGLKVEEAREKIMEYLETQPGIVVKRDAITQAKKISERGKTPIEIIPVYQRFVNLLDKKAILLQQNEKMTRYPEFMKKRSNDWINNLAWDWNISRSRKFWIPIPVWYEKETNKVLLPSEAQLSKGFIDPTRDLPEGYSAEQVTPETLVLDTWFTSGLSPLINEIFLKREGREGGNLIPFSLRPQAHDIIRTRLLYTTLQSYLRTGEIPLSCDINYSPSTNTNTNVVATLTSCNKPIMVTNNGGSTTYVFTGNGVFTFTYQDTYGNTWSTTATVNRIDKTPIVPTITYTATGRTNQDVTATISFNKSGVTVTPPYEGGQGGSGWYHTFTGNGSFTFTYQDAYGNNGSEIATVTRIDKISPTCDVSYSPATNTNGNVVASLTNCSETIIVTNTPNTNYTFTGNGSFTFQFSDPAGNTGSALATVTRIDASAIQATISYTPDTATSGNVQSLISFNKTWVSITSTSGATTTTLANDTSLFTDNGTFAYTYQDTFGNTGSSVAVVNRIDKTAPTCTVTYTPSTNTNQDVVASLTNCSETITWTAISHTFTSNDSFTFTFTDLVGNTWSTTATVTWINKTAIVSTITYSTTGATSGDVTASISFNKTGVTVNPPYEGGQGGSGWYHTFTDNGSFTFTYQDAYGNQGSETAIVSRIDKTAPTCSIIYTPNTNTNQNVIASLTNCSETITVLPPYEGGQGGSGTTYTFTGNDSFTFSFSDLVGNTGSTTATVNRIDKTAIIPTIAYDITGATNQNVTATLSFNKSWITITSDGGDSHLFTTTGSFTFHFHDGYGNTGSALATVTRIDKTAPILTLSYSPNTATNQPVLVTLSTDEPVTRPAGWSGNATGTTFTKIYSSDVSEPVTVYDLVGNQGQKWLTIDWIDKTAPTCSVDYSTTAPTNQAVTVTLTGCSETVLPYPQSISLNANGIGDFFFADLAGNSGSIDYEVNNIDATTIVASINYTPTATTTGNVVASISFNKSGVTVNPPYEGGQGGSGWYHTFTDNGSFSFTYQDAYGNTGSETAKVNWIDRTVIVPPTPPTPPSSANTGGGWGGTLKMDVCPNGDFSPSYYDGTCGGNEDEEHGAAGTEIPSTKTIYETAYERAKEYGITTASTYEEARTTDAILRQEMAKMISTYAIKLFQKTPDTEKIDCSQFKDLAQAGGDLQPYVIQSCQLGLMGMNGDGIGVQENFSPKSSITRAEFGTVLSRLLRGTTYASQLGDETYYGRHLQALKKAGIMNFISNPDMLELRGNILLMLWKSVVK